jgi:hypothetical protein
MNGARSKPAHSFRIGLKDILTRRIEMVTQPVKYLVRDVLLLGRELALVTQISNCVKYSKGLTGSFVQLGDRKSQEHVEAGTSHVGLTDRISCSDSSN